MCNCCKNKKAFLLTEAGHFIGHSLGKVDASSGMILNFETRKDVFPLVSGDRFGHAGNSFGWYMARWIRLKNRVFFGSIRSQNVDSQTLVDRLSVIFFYIVLV